VTPITTEPRVDTANDANSVPNSETTTQARTEGNATTTASVNSSITNDAPEKKSEPEAATALKANAPPFLFEQVSFPPSAELRYNAIAAQGARSLSGSGNIVWQHNEQSYTIKGEASALLLSLLSYQSSGQLGKAGILPDLYYEKRIGKSATQTHFVRERKTISFSTSTATYEIQGGEQDRGSVIWQLVGIARGDPTKLEPGLIFETVIAGSKAAVDKACEVLKANGAKRALLLPVSAPFHSSLMKPAADKLAAKLAETVFAAVQIPVINNIDVAVQTDAQRIRDALYRQAFGPVRWVECVQAIKSRGILNVVECGPGKVLAGMIKRIDAEMTGLAVFDTASLHDVKGQLA
jgi:hypothetical protein